MRVRDGRAPRAGGLLERTVAYLVDSVVTGLVWLFVVAALSGFDVGALARGGPRAVVAGFLFLLVPFAYFVIAEAATGTTVGKRLMGLRVRGPGGVERAGVFAVTVRNTLRLAWSVGPLGPFFLLLDAALIHQTELDQRVGDLAGRTLVVREGPAVVSL